jgi:hypothetical protein
MPTKKIIQYSLLHSLAVLIYITLVAWIMTNAQNVFGNMNGLLGPVAILSLFTVSAAIVGTLVFGRPVYLFFNGQKPDSIKLVLATIVCLFAETIIILLVLALTNTIS